MKVRELILRLSKLQQDKQIQVDVPSVRPGNEGPEDIKSIEWAGNYDSYLIEVD